MYEDEKLTARIPYKIVVKLKTASNLKKPLETAWGKFYQ